MNERRGDSFFFYLNSTKIAFSSVVVSKVIPANIIMEGIQWWK